jgi:hypothetical protein
MNDVMAHFESICVEFADAFRDELTWKWDGRFDAVLAAFQTEEQEEIKSFLEHHLKTVWDNSTIAHAPDAVRDVISHFGGLMPEQLLFASAQDQEILLCCAWWPWGNGDTVSIRMSLFPKSLSDEDTAVLRQKLRGWFNN